MKISKRWCAKSTLQSFVSLNARRQSEVAVVLLGIIPALSSFYIGRQGSELNALSPFMMPLLMLIAVYCGYVGYRVLRKYPNNIMELRTYISDLARGKLPESVVLSESIESDDLKYIEKSFSALVHEMQKEIARAKIQLANEHKLRETVERQQAKMLEMDHQKTMVDSVSIIYKRLGKPTEGLHRKLHVLSDQHSGQIEIEECINYVHDISKTLDMIRSAREFRHKPSAIDLAS
jgi:hypothetical protein